MEVEGDEVQQLEGELDLNCMAVFVQNWFKFTNFYLMGFSVNQQLTTTKAITKLAGSLEGSSLSQRRPCGGSQFDDCVVTFYEKDRQGMLSHNNRLLHLTAHIHDVELRHAMVDLGSLKLMPFSTLMAVRIPCYRIVKLSIKVLEVSIIHY